MPERNSSTIPRVTSASVSDERAPPSPVGPAASSAAAAVAAAAAAAAVAVAVAAPPRASLGSPNWWWGLAGSQRITLAERRRTLEGRHELRSQKAVGHATHTTCGFCRDALRAGAKSTPHMAHACAGHWKSASMSRGAPSSERMHSRWYDRPQSARPHWTRPPRSRLMKPSWWHTLHVALPIRHCSHSHRCIPLIISWSNCVSMPAQRMWNERRQPPMHVISSPGRQHSEQIAPR